MIFAELRNKLGPDAGSAHDRMEDVLTSNVFGLLRYLPAESALLPWIRSAVPIDPASRVGADAQRAEIHFWPRLRSGEVDILLLLGLPSGEVDLVAIECKYDSLKSGRARDALENSRADAHSAAIARDQLAKYFRDLRDRSFEVAFLRSRTIRRTHLIYLTANAAMPHAELEESLDALKDPSVRSAFFWLAWDQLWEPLARLSQVNSVEGLIASDLQALLKHKRLIPFQGFARVAAKLPLPAFVAWRTRWTRLGGFTLPHTAPTWRRRWAGLAVRDFSTGSRWRRSSDGQEGEHFE